MRGNCAMDGRIRMGTYFILQRTMLLLQVLYLATLVGKSSSMPLGNGTSPSVNDTLVWPESSSRDLNFRHCQPSSLQRPMFLLEAYSAGDPSLPLPDGKGPHCRRKAKCIPLNNATCFSARLPYTSTSLDLVGMTQEQIQEKLQFWTALKHVPKCWAVIQPFLCALYMPRCENDLVELPSQEMCKMAMGPCKILKLERGWTSPLRCDDTSRFPSMCKNDACEAHFNTTGECLAPLVPTSNPSAFYEVDDCGLQCANTMFTSDEIHQLEQFIAWAGGICACANLLTIASFFIDWRSTKKYPGVIIFYISWCFLLVCASFLVQFFPGVREEIVCRKDGTLRMSEPSQGENLLCVLVFAVLYFFLMAACVWLSILAYAWHTSFKAFGKMPVRIEKKRAQFHLFAWSVPFILTIINLSVHEIDASSELGICFVGYVNPDARGGLLFGPVSILFSAAVYFVLSGLVTLIKLKINSSEIVHEKFSAKIRSTIIRVGVFMLFLIIFFICTIVVHLYEHQHRRSWRESLRTFVICKIMRSGGVLTDGVGLTGHGDCRMELRPSLTVVKAHLLALFGTGVAMSAFIWTPSTYHTWIRFFKRIFLNQEDDSRNMKKHKIIAQMFAKRQGLKDGGTISINHQYDDPVGINFELNSFGSENISSAWYAAVLSFTNRRGACIPRNTASISSQFSDYNYGARRGSRRQSLDSQLSAALCEFCTNFKVGLSPGPSLLSSGVSGGRVTPKRKRKKFRARRPKIGMFKRHDSFTSVESHIGTHTLSTLEMDLPKVPVLVPNLKRRNGNAGLSDDEPLPTILAARDTYGLPDPSDVTDDDTPQARTLEELASLEKSCKELENTITQTLMSTYDTRKHSINKVFCENREQKIDSELEDYGRNNKSNGSKLANNRRSRESSSDSYSSTSPDRSGRNCERSGVVNGGKKRSIVSCSDKIKDKKVDGKLKILKSKELNLDSTKMTKTRDGYFAVKPGSNDNSSSDSSGDDEKST